MIAILIATTARPTIVLALAEWLARQRRPADHIVFVSPATSDIPLPMTNSSADGPTKVVSLTSRRGLCSQRNVGVRHLCEAFGYDDDDIIVMIDDDFLPREDWLENLAGVMASHASCAGVTGVLLGDGAQMPRGIAVEVARHLLMKNVSLMSLGDWRRKPGPVANLYGCNMAVRAKYLKRLHFDERLPLYGWLEDSDFSAQLASFGPLLRSDRLVGVHLGTKSGRISGIRFGYSQVANNLYLMRKGTLSLNLGWKLAVRAFLGNMIRTFIGVHEIDYAGRFRGNVMALIDIVRFRSRPERILEL